MRPLITLLLLLTPTPLRTQAGSRPNILSILPDDRATWAMGNENFLDADAAIAATTMNRN